MTSAIYFLLLIGLGTFLNYHWPNRPAAVRVGTYLFLVLAYDAMRPSLPDPLEVWAKGSMFISAIIITELLSYMFFDLLLRKARR